MLLPFEKVALNFTEKAAIIDQNGSYTYTQLLSHAQGFASKLLGEKQDLYEARVAFMVAPGFDYVKTQWAIWLAGGIAVPINMGTPLPSIQYILEDTEAAIFVSSQSKFEEFSALNQSISFISTDIDLAEISTIKLPELDPERRAMILYTSGTTSLPKGVVTTHKNIAAQVESLQIAWQWTSKDHILCVLPLHHIHGIINVVSCSLWSGATLQFLPAFSAQGIFDTFLEGKINLFMAVPTIYFKLIDFYNSLDKKAQKKTSECLRKFRLMVSGSAALPVSVMEQWKAISGHVLLERYGMTEIGMGIGNPYLGERKAGYIGVPLPDVQARIVGDDGELLAENNPGEIQIKGDTVFKEYWRKPEATGKAFTTDGWFKTGDVAVVEDGYYRILGRDSVDIIKSGGYKISALEIEEVLRKHPDIADCSVVGLPNDEWGELVAAALIPNTDTIDIEQINQWMRTQISTYKCPRNYKILTELPRNAMGKVVKNELKNLF